MNLEPLDMETVETKKGMRYLVRRQLFLPDTNRRGETRYFWRGSLIPVPFVRKKQGRFYLSVFGLRCPVRFLALAVGLLAVAAALWAWLGR